MKRNRICSFLTAAILSLTVTSALPGQVFAADYTASKQRVSVHDPSVVKDLSSGNYYIFGSHIEAAKTSDLQNWRIFSNGYARTGNKLFGNLSENLKKAFAWAGEDLGDCEGGFAVWAPDVVWNPDYVNENGSKGAYLMYFCTSSDYRTSVIAYAASQDIEGPYSFVDTLIYSGFTDTTVNWGNARKTVSRRYSNTNISELIDSGAVTFNSQWFDNHYFNNKMFPNAIDPTIYTGADGKMYMCYGSWSGGIFTLEIDKSTGRCIHPETGTTTDGRMVDSYFGTKISGGYGKSGEGPFIEYNADTGFYYLWVTYGGLTSSGGYNMRVGRSRSPLGPFVDAAGRNMVLNSDTNLNSIGLKLMTNYKFSSLPRAYMACGHNSVLKDDDGRWYLIYHTRFDDGAEFHEVRVHSMQFSEAGWPVVMPYEYSGEAWSEAGFEPDALAGTYEFINHGTGTDGNITTASEITLASNGTITGAVTGTWKQDSRSAAAEFQIGNDRYTGFFNTQYDESGTGKCVMTFTASGSSNQSIWGVQTAPWTGSERREPQTFTGSGQLCYDQKAVTDTAGSLLISDTALLSNVPYTITNVNSGLVLEAANPNGAKPGTGIQQWAKRGNKSGDANQDFRLTDIGNGWCRITSMQDETLCIAVQESTGENGVAVELQTYNGSDNQLWKPVKSGSYYGIVSKCSDGTAALDVYEWSKENGGVIKQWEFWGGECQLWKITPTYAAVPSRAYALRNTATGKFVGTDGTTLIQTAQATGWELQKDPESELCFLTDGRKYAVTARSDGSFTVQPYHGSDGQLFRISCSRDGSYTLCFGNDEQNGVFLSANGSGQFISEKTPEGDAAQFVLSPCDAPIPEQALTTADTTETTKGQTVILPGDVDCDGSVRIADAVLLARYLAEDSEVTVTANGKINAELDKQEGLSSDELVLLLQHLAGTVSL
ncbi:MAG: family 43 glycosylhydrolase [Oscillospiraceae bacterium]|nr:family 43 glycosylhydrolase [Oscillospiraceae bacterium]